MGSPDWQSLLDELIHVRDAQYRDDVQREDAIKEIMMYVLQTTLEKLRNAQSPQETAHD